MDIKAQIIPKMCKGKTVLYIGCVSHAATEENQ